MHGNFASEINKLSIAERILLVEEIWDSIARDNEYAELSEVQRIELTRRMDSYHTNPQQGRSWNDIKHEFWGKHS